MSEDQQIRATIQTYFDCMYDSSAEKTHAAFHPSAKITGYLEETEDGWSIYNKLFHVEGPAG